MRLTVLRAKEAIRHRVPDDKLDSRLNRVVERLITHAKYNDSMHRLVISAPYGQLTLPRRYSTIEGVNVNGVVHPMANTWSEWLPGHSDICFTMDNVQDLGDGWAVIRTPRVTPPETPDYTAPAHDFPTGGTITVDFDGPNDTDVKVLIEGTDSNGLAVSLQFAGQQTQANIFSRITRVHKEQGSKVITITFTTGDAIETIIDMMEPKEEEAYYHRYLIQTHTSQPEVGVIAYAKRRHIEFTSDSDVLPFSSIYALERGCDAMQYEDENDIVLASQYWGQAVDALNDELKTGITKNAQPVIRFHYPGGTAPRLTSHY